MLALGLSKISVWVLVLVLVLPLVLAPVQVSGSELELELGLVRRVLVRPMPQYPKRPARLVDGGLGRRQTAMSSFEILGHGTRGLRLAGAEI